MSQYTDILARLRAATGPDRELDIKIWLATTAGATRQTIHVDHPQGAYDIDETRDASRRLITVPSFTASIDAALSLVAEKLPGWDWMLGNRDGEHPQEWPWASLTLPGWEGDEESQFLEHASTPPLAILTALFTALEE